MRVFMYVCMWPVVPAPSTHASLVQSRPMARAHPETGDGPAWCYLLLALVLAAPPSPDQLSTSGAKPQPEGWWFLLIRFLNETLKYIS